MLRLCSENEINTYVDFAYELASDLTKSSYPTYCDGIKTKEMFVQRAIKAFERKNEEILLFLHDGNVRGLIHYFWLPEDRYLETIGFHISKGTEQALSEFLTYIAERFKGYDVYFGFPVENEPAVRFLAEQGFECITNNYNNTAFLDRLDILPENCGIVEIGRENYKSFQTLHRQPEEEMYFTSERIFEDLDNWHIFVKLTDSEPQSAVYYKKLDDGWFEIFGIDMIDGKYDPKQFKELLNAALFDAKRRGGRFMTFFCEKEYEEAALACGFTCMDNYLCYKARLE